MLFQFAQYGCQRHDEDSAEEVADSMDKIPRQSGHDPRNCFIKIKSVQQSMCRGIECAVQKSMDSTYYHVYNGLYFLGNAGGDKHHDTPQNSPQIQVGNPPAGKTAK